MSAGSSGRLTVPSADRMRLQLDDMLEQRNAAEAFQAEVHRHRRTASLLEEESSKLLVANSEVIPLPNSKPDLSVILCLSCMTVLVLHDCFCCCSAPCGTPTQHHCPAIPLIHTCRMFKISGLRAPLLRLACSNVLLPPCTAKQ